MYVCCKLYDSSEQVLEIRHCLPLVDGLLPMEAHVDAVCFVQRRCRVVFMAQHLDAQVRTRDQGHQLGGRVQVDVRSTPEADLPVELVEHQFLHLKRYVVPEPRRTEDGGGRCQTGLQDRSQAIGEVLVFARHGDLN